MVVITGKTPVVMSVVVPGVLVNSMMYGGVAGAGRLRPVIAAALSVAAVATTAPLKPDPVESNAYTVTTAFASGPLTPPPETEIVWADGVGVGPVGGTESLSLPQPLSPRPRATARIETRLLKPLTRNLIILFPYCLFISTTKRRQNGHRAETEATIIPITRKLLIISGIVALTLSPNFESVKQALHKRA
jgi:hypothetical protein